MQNSLKWILGVITIVVTISLGVWSWSLVRTQINMYPSKSANFTGKAVVNVKPDVAVVSIAVVTQGKDAKSAQADNDAKVTAVRDFLKGSGIVDGDIKTSNYNLYPQYDYDYCNRQKDLNSSNTYCTPQIVSFEMNQSLEFKVRDFDKLGDIVGQVTQKGANQIHGITFTIEDPDKYRQDAVVDAIAKAKEKAEVYAKATGFKLGKIVSIYENSYVPPMPYYADGKGGAEMNQVGSPIEAGSQEVSVEMSITYEIK